MRAPVRPLIRELSRYFESLLIRWLQVAANWRFIVYRKLLGVLAASTIALGAVGATTPAGAGAANAFDGRWMVRAAANPGRCSDKYGIAISVANGQVTYRGLLAAFATGKLSRDGQLLLQIGEARVTGRLASANGGGLWASPKCKGTWTATRL